MIKFMVPLSFLLAAFHLASLMRDIWHPGFHQREWEGERHLEGGLSELSILPAAQQVKVTLYFVYFWATERQQTIKGLHLWPFAWEQWDLLKCSVQHHGQSHSTFFVYPTFQTMLRTSVPGTPWSRAVTQGQTRKHTRPGLRRPEFLLRLTLAVASWVTQSLSLVPQSPHLWNE